MPSHTPKPIRAIVSPAVQTSAVQNPVQNLDNSSAPRDSVRTYSIDDSWRDRLQMWGKPERPRANLNNAIIALRYSPDWRGVLVYNEFTHRVYKRSRTPWGGPSGEWLDADNRRATAWLQQEDIDVNTSITADAVQTAAEDQPSNPLVDYLTSLEWDGIPRVDSWLRDYLGVLWNDYSCAVGRAWLISACARAMQPGCKADHCLILEGPQGRGKSSALRTLAGSEYFTDYVSGDLAGKDAIMACAGRWIIEFSELEGISHLRSKVEAAKSFLSRTEDYYRPPYGKYMVTVPRTCVFAATTNSEVYMPDESGNRRFWPVTVGHISLKPLERDRDQLWAEAYKLWADGEAYWLDTDLERTAAKEQEIRYDNDPWQDAIEIWIKRKDRVAVRDILNECLHQDLSTQTRGDQMRVARCLKAMGWQMRRTDKFRWYERPPRPDGSGLTTVTISKS